MDFGTLNHDIILCRKCPRLVDFRESVAVMKRKAYRDWEYWGKPVPAFGDVNGRLMVVGLAPGPHGSNRTGRMFTGDASGRFLYRALFKAGFANQPEATDRQDGLVMSDMLITAVCRCVPPENKPSRVEIATCTPYLLAEIELMPNLQGLIALGRIAFDQLLVIYHATGVKIPRFTFKHGEMYALGAGKPWLIASYHPSQQNTLTGRLTVEMFDQVWQKAKEQLV
jgi:uracil-DNA glycosylase